MEIIEHLKYYTPELPRETLKQALEHKEEIEKSFTFYLIEY